MTYAEFSPIILGGGELTAEADGAGDFRIPRPPAGGYNFSSIAPVLGSVLGILAGEPAPAAPQSADSSGLSGGTIAGIAIGAVAGAVLLVGGAWLAYRRRHVVAKQVGILPTARHSDKGR